MSQSVGSIHYDLSLKTAQFDAAVAKTNAQVSTMGEKFSAAGATMMKIGGAMTLASAAVVFTGAKFVSLAGDLQTTQQRMEALTGSSAEAKRIMGELYTYVLGKPIAFPDASKAAQVLMGYGVQSSKVVDSMKTLSAFSIVNGADMSQLALAYGQVNAKGHLMGQEIIQLTNNFVPVSQVIAKHFNVSVQEAMQLMEDGKISAQDFNAAMAGFIPQEKIEAMSNTFKNRMISLQGSVRSFGLALLGVKMDKELGLVVEKGGVFDMLSNLLPKIAAQLSKVGKWFKELSPFGKQLAITFAAIFIAAGPVLLVLGSMAAAVGAIVALGAPVLLVIAGIIAVGAALVYLQLKFGLITKAFDALRPFIKILTDAFKDLWGQIKELGTLIMSELKPVIDWLQEHIEGVKKVLKILLVVGLAPVIAAFGFLVTAIKTVTKAIEVSIEMYQRLKKSTKDLSDKIIDYISDVKEAWDKLVESVERVVNKVSGYLESLKNTAKDAGNVISTMFSGGIDSGKILDGLNKVNDALATAINTKLSEWTSAIQKWIDDFPTKLSGIGTAISNAWEEAKKKTLEFFQSLAGVLKPEVDKAGQETASNLGEGLANSMKSHDTIRKVGDAIMLMIGLATAAIFIYGWDLMFRIGNWIVEGLGTGIRVSASGVWWAIKTVADQIGGFFNGAWNWLYNAGVGVIDGFIRGIKSKAGEVKNALLDLTNKIPSWKGPMSVDKVLLKDNANAIMDGFINGLESNYSKVGSSLQSLTASMPRDITATQSIMPITPQPINIYGNIEIGDRQTADYFFTRLNRGQDLSSMGLAG